MDRKTFYCNEFDEHLIEFTINEIEAGNPDVINEKLLSDIEKGGFNSSNSNEEIQRNPELPNKSYSDATDTVTSSDQEILNKSSQIEIYSDERNNNNKDTKIAKNTPNLNAKLENKETDILVPENVEIIQGLLLNSGRGNSSHAPGIASESKDLPFKKDQKVLKEHGHEHSKKRTEWTETGDSEAFELSRQDLYDSNEQILSSNNDYEGLNSDLTNKISAQTHLVEQSHFSHQPLQVDGKFKNNFMKNGENRASNTNISEIIGKESTESTILCSGESKAESIPDIDKLASTPGPSCKKTLMCPICKTEINEHAILHEGKSIYKCCFCEHRSNSKNNLKQHMHKHGPNPFSCEVCGEMLKERDSHDTEHTCKECERTFQCKTLLLRHSITHTSHCIICWRGMDQHEISEYAIRYYKCCECVYKTDEKTHLHKHFYSHFKERAFRCVECGKRFKHSSSLIRHRKENHPEKVPLL